MAIEKEEVILEFKIDQGAALKDLEKIEKALLDNKEAQKELNDAYKKGVITQEEYIKENLRLQQNIKAEQEQRRTLNKAIETESNSRNALKLKVSQLTKEYDNLNLKTAEGVKRQKELEKELSTLNTQISKTSKQAGLFKDQIGNYPQQFGEAAKSINVAGVSIGDIGTKLAAFANPATAAVGIVTALGAAYARSTLGAKDLEFASNELSTATTILTNNFAKLFVTSKDGSGIMAKITEFFIRAVGGIYGQSLVDQVKKSAQAIEDLEDLEREELGIRDKVNDRLETNQELLTEISAEQTTFNNKIKDADTIVSNLRKNESDLVGIKKQQLDNIKFQLSLDKDNENIQNLVLEKQREISNIEKDTEKRVQAILRLKDNINQANNKEIEAEKLKLRIFDAQAKSFLEQKDAEAEARLNEVPQFSDSQGPDKPSVLRTDQGVALDTATRLKEEKEFNVLLKEVIGEREYIYIDDYKAFDKAEKLKQQSQLQALSTFGNVTTALSALAQKGSDEQKELAIAGIAIDTAAAVAGGVSESQDLPYPANLAAMASTIAAILAAIAQAKAIAGFAEGGYTGPGDKYQPKGIVHANEFVVPSETVNKYGVGHFNKYLPGYADGGLVTSSLTQHTNEAVLQSNAFKYMPAPVVSVKEFNLVANRVKVKENISTL